MVKMLLLSAVQILGGLTDDRQKVGTFLSFVFFSLGKRSRDTFLWKKLSRRSPSAASEVTFLCVGQCTVRKRPGQLCRKLRLSCQDMSVVGKAVRDMCWTKLLYQEEVGKEIL